MLSKEEKKAIEWIKKADWFSARLYSLTIFNLIETQQKEIKELKEGLRKRITYCNELEKDLFENCSNYVVSKDKIKAKIKEYKKQIEELKDSQIFTQTEYEGGIKFGQSLLKEE